MLRFTQNTPIAAPSFPPFMYYIVLPFPFHQLPPPRMGLIAQRGECRPLLLTRPRGHRFEPATEVITLV